MACGSHAGEVGHQQYSRPSDRWSLLRTSPNGRFSNQPLGRLLDRNLRTCPVEFNHLHKPIFRDLSILVNRRTTLLWS